MRTVGLLGTIALVAVAAGVVYGVVAGRLNARSDPRDIILGGIGLALALMLAVGVVVGIFYLLLRAGSR